MLYYFYLFSFFIRDKYPYSLFLILKFLIFELVHQHGSLSNYNFEVDLYLPLYPIKLHKIFHHPWRKLSLLSLIACSDRPHKLARLLERHQEYSRNTENG